MRAAILGCGPAGLLAALAAEQHGYEPVIMSNKAPSVLFGAQYLHRDIPDLHLSSATINYGLVGTADGYRRKQYGDAKVKVSPESLDTTHMGWDIRAAYDQLWKKYESAIRDVGVFGADDMDTMFHVLLDDIEADIVFNTVPLPALCVKKNEHKFEAVEGYAFGDYPSFGRTAPFAPAEDNTVICDGTIDVSWYRLSKVFGCTTIEWPKLQVKPPVEGLSLFRKPISTNCDCHSWMKNLGRFGRWQKGVLASDAYDDAVAALSVHAVAR